MKGDCAFQKANGDAMIAEEPWMPSGATDKCDKHIL